jgi:xanthosine utilization system XapX-like protein
MANLDRSVRSPKLTHFALVVACSIVIGKKVVKVLKQLAALWHWHRVEVHQVAMLAGEGNVEERDVNDAVAGRTDKKVGGKAVDEMVAEAAAVDKMAAARIAGEKREEFD